MCTESGGTGHNRHGHAAVHTVATSCNRAQVALHNPQTPTHGRHQFGQIGIATAFQHYAKIQGPLEALLACDVVSQICINVLATRVALLLDQLHDVSSLVIVREPAFPVTRLAVPLQPLGLPPLASWQACSGMPKKPM